MTHLSTDYYSCHESGYHSLYCTAPMDYISHHALHSHIPVHHYTNHTAVTIHSSTLLPHHTCTSFTHSHKSSTQTLTHCEVLFCPGYISERSSPYLLSLCVTPDCLTLDFWTCACDLDPCLVLFTSLLCLRYSCYALWPLLVWFCLCPINKYITALGSPAFDQSLQKTSPPQIQQHHLTYPAQLWTA